MIAMLTFSAVAALLVYLAGRGDAARDPRLTLVALGLLAVFPGLWLLLPKVGVLPVTVSTDAGVGAVGEGAGFSWMWLVAAVWSVGFVFGAVRLALAARGISTWWRLSELIGREEGVEIRRLEGLRGPVAAGVFRKVVFVPESWEDWSNETRRIVLEHELAHHRRRDPLWRWIAELACVVQGCNPLVTWMARRLAVQCEYACDALVLSRGGVAARDYARLLCDFADDDVPHGPVLAMSAGSSLESRVRRLMKPAGKRGGVIVPVMLAVVIGVAAGLAMLAPQVEESVGADEVFSKEEVETRWSAEAFQGN